MAGIDDHTSAAHWHNASADDIIFNPGNHFYYKGIKFVSLSLLRDMKLCRGEEKDLLDVKIIDSLLKKDAA